MANTKLNFDINFRTRGNFGPLSQGLNQIRAQSAGAFGAMTTPAIRTKSAIDGLASSLERKRLTLSQTRVALRNTSAVLKEHNALLKATAISYKNATGAGKTYLTINRAMTGSVATLNQRFRYTATVLNAASTSLINFGKNVQWAGRQVMMGLTLPLMLVGSAASKAAEDLDRQLVRIVKVTNVSTYKLANEFGELGASMRAAFDVGDASAEAQERVQMIGGLIRDQARALTEFGASMGFVAEETGKIGAEFAQMGYQGFQLDALTKSALTLSRVSGTDLNDSIQLVRLTVQAFGNSIGSLEEKFARLNLIENNTSLSLAEMAQGIPIVASVADNLGISIENLAGMLAVMKEQGIAAREGATALRTGLIQLIQKPTRNAVEAFELINVNLNEMQERNRGDIIGFFNELALTMENMSGSGRQGQANLEMFTQALATLTGVRASARFLSLISEMGNLEKVFDEDTQEEVWKVKEGLDENTVAARAFINTIYDSERAINIYQYELDQVNNSLSGIRDRLKAELNVELAKMGESFLRVGNAVREAINNALRAFNSLSDRTQNIIFAFGTFIAVLGPLTMFLGIFANALGQIAKGVTSLLPKMKLMTAAQVAEARAQEITNNGLAVSLALKEDMIATNIRLAASTNALATSSVLATHGMFGTAPLPMSIRPGASPAQRRMAAMGVLSKQDQKAVTAWRDYQGSQRAMQAAGVYGPATPAAYPGPVLMQQASSSKVAGSIAAGSMMAPNLLKAFPGADLGYMSTTLKGGTASVAQLMQQELEKDLLRTRNAALASGAIGIGSRSGKPVQGPVLDKQFNRYLKRTGYNANAKLSQIAMLAGQTGLLGQTAVDQSFFRYATGMAPALAAGTVVSGQSVKGGISKGTQLGSRAMADVIHNERLFQLAQMQRGGAPLAMQVASQQDLLAQQAAAMGLSGAAQKDYVRKNMPRTLPAAPGPQGPARTAAPAVARSYTPRSRNYIQKPTPPPPPPPPPNRPAKPPRKTRPVRGLLAPRARSGGLSGYGMQVVSPFMQSPLARYTASPMGMIGARGGAKAAAAATGAAIVSSGQRASAAISSSLTTASEVVSRNVRNAGIFAGSAIADAAGRGYATAATMASRGRQKAGDLVYAASAATSLRARSAVSRTRAAGWRAIEGISGRTGGLPQVVSGAQLANIREQSLIKEFKQLEDMGRAPQGVSQQQYVTSGMAQQKGVKGRASALKSAVRGTQGPYATRFMAGVQRGSQSAGFLNKALMAAMVMPLKAPFKAISTIGKKAAGGLRSVADGSSKLAKSPLFKGVASKLLAGGGMAKGALGFALGAGLKLALPLTIIFGTLAITNKDEFMSGLMSVIQAPMDRLKSAWDGLTQSFQYLIFLFRNMRGDGSGAFARIAEMVGKAAGRIGTVLMDALTTVITVIQSVFKFVEGLVKFFSGDMSGAMEAFGEAFKLLGIAILEIILNIIDSIVGWVPLLDKVIGRAKQTVATWRENITALTDVEKALVQVDKSIRTIKKASDGMNESFDESKRSVERMAELEIIPMDKVEALQAQLSGWRLDPFSNMDEQLDGLGQTIASMDTQLEGLPPQIMDAIFTFLEQDVILRETNRVLEEQEAIRNRLLGDSETLTESDRDELESLRMQTSEMQAQAAVLESILGGNGKVDAWDAKEWTDDMKVAAEELVEAGLIYQSSEGGWVTSAEYAIREGIQRELVNDFMTNFNNLQARRNELEGQTLAGLVEQEEQLRLQEEAKRLQLELIENDISLAMDRSEENEEYQRLLEQQAALDLELNAISAQRGDIAALVAQQRISAEQLANNQSRLQERERHLEVLRNAEEEARARASALATDPEAYRFAMMSVRSIQSQIISAESAIVQLKQEGAALDNESASTFETMLQTLADYRKEWSEARSTAAGMFDEGDASEIENNAENSVSSVANAFKSAMSEMISQIATAFNSVISDQTERVSEHFSNISSATDKYFDDYLKKLSEQTKEIMDQIDQREQAEEDAINAVADLRIQSIEDQAEAEARLDEERERFFRREQARIDYIRSRATADVQIREAILKGDRGRAAILRIEQEMAAQQFYNDILKEREDDLRRLREEEREKQISSIEDEREAALRANEERASIERIAVEETERNAEQAAKVAQERAEKEIEAAEKAAEEATELEKYRIEQYLKEWQAVTPATEEEFQKHLAALQNFFDQSNNRLRSEINRIYADFSVVFDSMSTEFKDTNNSLMNTLRDRLGSVETQYINTNNNILGAIHSTNVEMANSIDDILNNIGESTTTTETILGNARESFKNSIVGMLDELSIASGETLVDFTDNFVPEFTGNMDWAFGEVTDIADEFSKRFGNDLEAGFETATDRAIAALTEEQKWKEAENQIAAYMASIASHLDITLPGPSGGGGSGDSGGNGSGTGSSIPELRQGMRSTGGMYSVQALQKSLNVLGFRDNSGRRLSEDGIFGAKTKEAVMNMQRFYNQQETTKKYVSNLEGIVRDKEWRGLQFSMHTGGLVGSESNYSGKGLKNDEVSMVLQKGEYVINRRAVSTLGTDFLDRINSVQARFSSPRASGGTLRNSMGSVSSSTTNTYNLSFQVDGGNIDEQKLAQKVVFEIKKMERDMGAGRRIS